MLFIIYFKSCGINKNQNISKILLLGKKFQNSIFNVSMRIYTQIQTWLWLYMLQISYMVIYVWNELERFKYSHTLNWGWSGLLGIFHCLLFGISKYNVKARIQDKRIKWPNGTYLLRKSQNFGHMNRHSYLINPEVRVRWDDCSTRKIHPLSWEIASKPT